MTADGTSYSWSTSQLVEYLAVLSEQPDEASARRAAVERVLESLDAEVGVLFGGGIAPVVIGLPHDGSGSAGTEHDAAAGHGHDRAGHGHDASVSHGAASGPDGVEPEHGPAGGGPVAALIEAASGGASTVPVNGLGPCRTVVVNLDVGDDPMRLLVARSGSASFLPDEMLLLRGMAWVLALALRPLRVVTVLNERQRVLEHMSTVQRAIASRAPLPEVFDVVTDSALSLFGAELAMLHLVDRDELMLVSVAAGAEEHRPRWLTRAGTGVANQVYLRGELVRTDDYRKLPDSSPDLVALGARAVMGAPVRENGVVVGSLLVISFRRGHAFADAQAQALLTFADQVSVALSDAKSLATAQRAVRDPVTGLPNRMLFLDLLQRALDSGSQAHVLFLDLDRFKLVNDTLGHAAGDDLLSQIGRRLRGPLSGSDCLARFGGDEYAVLMENATDAEVMRFGEQMLATVQETYLVGGEEVVVGGSIGVASGQDRTTSSEVMRDADTAMYRAKNAGGNRIVVFEQRMHAAAVQRRTLETDLRQAVRAEALDVVYQPIVDLRTRRLQSAEALARWEHPVLGAVPPADFIPLAEEHGLIAPLGRHILERACREASDWPPATDTDRPPDLSVNVSARQLLDPSFIKDVRAVLADTDFDPRRLILEITESTIISDLDCVLDLMRKLRDLGIRLAIDDFGTGYSSLSYLRMFPVDILKIDRSFVESIGAPWHGAAFIGAIMRLSEALSLTVVAEGVETLEQVRVLSEVGCHIGQGYLFAPPMTAAGIIAYARCGGSWPCAAGFTGQQLPEPSLRGQPSDQR